MQQPMRSRSPLFSSRHHPHTNLQQLPKPPVSPQQSQRLVLHISAMVRPCTLSSLNASARAWRLAKGQNANSKVFLSSTAIQASNLLKQGTCDGSWALRYGTEGQSRPSALVVGSWQSDNANAQAKSIDAHVTGSTLRDTRFALGDHCMPDS